MKSKTQTLLTIMKVLAWTTFFGLIVQGGAILITYVVSFTNAEGAKNLYQGMNWYDVRQFNFSHYTLLVTLMVTVLFMKAYIAQLVAKLISKITLVNPFKPDVAKMMERISYLILIVWVIAIFFNLEVDWLSSKVANLKDSTISLDFIYLAGIIFVFAQIFKKGVEIQTENELTV